MANVNLEFDRTPSTPLHRLVLTRRRGLKAGQAVPAMRATLRGVTPDPGPYARICSFARADPLPLPYLQVLAAPIHMQLIAHKDFPLPALGLVHVSQDITQHRPIAATERLALECAIGATTPARRGVEVELTTRALAGEECVWEGLTVFLSMAVQGTGEVKARPEPPAFEPARSTMWSLPADLGWRYGTIAGDRNPIHIHPLTARPFGYKKPIIHGMWTLARAVAELDRVDAACQLHVDFRRPVSLPGKALFESGPVQGAQAFAIRRPVDGKPCVLGTLKPL